MQLTLQIPTAPDTDRGQCQDLQDLADDARRSIARDAAGLLAAFPERDRGGCRLSRLTGDEDAPFAPCTGRMVATYRETSHRLTAYPVWVCSVCGGTVVP